MKLLRKLGTQLDKNGKKQSWAIFKCPKCLQEVVRLLGSGDRQKSCGCYINVKHKGSYTRLYNTWAMMKQRCLNPNVKQFKNYGGRGIIICPEWTNDYIAFRDWSLSNGYKEGLQINRINNDGNYEPSNCRWITNGENLRNTRHCKVTLDIANEIRGLYKSGNYSTRQLAKIFNLNSKSTIVFIINNKTWKNEEYPNF